MKGAIEAGKLLADSIAARQRILIIADYDCDGATACALGLRGLRMFGAQSWTTWCRIASRPATASRPKS